MSRNVVNPGIDRDSWRPCSVKLTREGLPAGTTWEPLDCHRPSPGDRAIGMWKGKVKQSETEWNKVKQAETCWNYGYPCSIYDIVHTHTHIFIHIVFLWLNWIVTFWHFFDMVTFDRFINWTWFGATRGGEGTWCPWKCSQPSLGILGYGVAMCCLWDMLQSNCCKML